MLLTSESRALPTPRFLSTMYQDRTHWRQRLRSKAVCTVASLVLLITVAAIISLSDYRVPLHKTISTSLHLNSPETPPTHLRGKNADPEAVHLKGVKSKYAFATFLAGTDQELEYKDDHYLIATRILAYQLLHANETRSSDPDIPFIVIVTDKVKEPSRERLRKDGAIVVEVPSLTADWLSPSISAWDNVMTKLRLWELVDFSRIAFLDADTVLAAPLDDIFSDPAADERHTNTSATMTWPSTPTAPAPTTYVFAGNAEHQHEHHFPPTDEGRDWPNIRYLNAGFFVLQPSLDLLRYYISILRMPDAFNSELPEQNLLNKIHSWEGDMPWKQLSTTLNVHYPTMKDVRAGAKSVHEKWWGGEDAELRIWMEGWRGRMEGFFEARDQAS
ncbi:glycosyltransferase family 8 protein [Myriangium duriaei CBS 260.36]|uniref:Glycosyltransferase family 8 protein n=1 Tax=Myriangium duriaei CBS 260.36 TaxID=1168546 RepID=A0A9P4IZZ2_9PEZI|nr:glycosyltransferase family 8 protein [Myriangium duriaei CBS 260.36]